MKTPDLFCCSTFLLLALNMPAHVLAADLYKCVSSNGATSIQDHPCRQDATVAWIRPVESDMRTSADQRTLRERDARERDDPEYLAGATRANHNARPAARGHQPRQSSNSNSRHAKCEAARKHRQRVESSAGSKKTAKLLIKLDEQVYDACK